MLRDDPTNPQAYYYLGRIALDEKKPAEAAEYFSKTMLLSPDLEQAYYYLALAQIETSKGSEALATLDKARQKFPQNFALEMLTGMAYSAQKGYAEAIQHYISAEVIAKATEPKRLNEGFYFQLGAAYERKGDYEQAEKYFEKCLQLAPNSCRSDELSRLHVGGAWHEAGAGARADRKGGQGRAEERGLSSTAWLGAFQAQPARRRRWNTCSRQPSCPRQPDATVFDHLGDIYAALKQPEKAREAWQKSLSLEPNEAVRKKLEAAGENEAKDVTSETLSAEASPAAEHGLPVRETLHAGRSAGAAAADPAVAASGWLNCAQDLEQREERLAGLMAPGCDLGGSLVNAWVRLMRR